MDPKNTSQFAPRNALDMVRRIPGFTIDDGNRGQRGLGQANQNVIVNGERFSSKSDSIRDQLQRIPASDIVRIEILDGTALDIPGMTGQVANIVARSVELSGSWRYAARFEEGTEPQLLEGEVTLTGERGDLEF